ncbi:DUF3466 family protein [Massilia forsythiae]|uniref:DUF3466 family protein n=1 Tax=Massilia forsythiae TaxID=2728020 RepID=A0A7Z2VT34_9BURK|nr:DUF3466 family protein [Massilia forsythiae]QJD98693.1 DUF3466 family protein [Massilia forsythiae]
MNRFSLLHYMQLLAAVSLAAPLLANADVRYTVTEVAGAGSNVSDLNNLGQVVGSLRSGDSYHAFVYTNGDLTDLGTFGGTDSHAYAINDHGQVAGSAFDTPTNGPWRGFTGFVYSGGSMSAIRETGNSFAYGINNNGTVVGAMTVGKPGDVTHDHAYTYTNGVFTDLGTLPIGDFSYAYAINNTGDVVGAAGNVFNGAPNFPHDPFLYRDGTMTSLGNLGGPWSTARSINDHGQIVGYLGTDSNVNPDDIYPSTAFLYENGVMRNLGGPSPLWSSAAYDINNLGQIVGSAGLGDFLSHGFLYENGAMVDLNVLIDPESGWVIQDAAAINDLQQIAATACRGDVCQAVRLDLVPAVPEPAAYALLLGGLLLGWRRGGARRYWKTR